MTTMWAEWIDSYCRWFGTDASRGTVRLHRHYLSRLAALTDSPASVTLDDLVHLIGDPKWAASARKSARGAVAGFYRWAVLTERLASNPTLRLPSVRVPAGRPRPAPDAVLAAALCRADERGRLMLLCAALAGLRCCEICKLHSDDVVGGSLRVVGKGGRVRDVPLHPDLAAALDGRSPGFVFPGRVGGHLSPMWVSNTLGDLLGRPWTAHTLRHRFASLCYAYQRDILAVQTLLGHASVTTTQIYTAVPDGAMRAAVYAVAPVAA